MVKLPPNPDDCQAVLDGIRHFDLPGFLRSYYGPRAIVYASRTKASIRCLWRGDNNPSGSLTYMSDGWVWKDFGRQEKGGTLVLLAEKMGLGYEAAWDIVTGRHIEGGRKSFKYTPPPQIQPAGGLTEPTANVQQQMDIAFDRMNDGKPPRQMMGRGLSFDDMLFYGIGKGANGGDAWLPILDPAGKVTAVKVRYDVPKNSKQARYKYPESGYRHTTYHAPGFSQATKGIIMVEGELKAVSVHNAGRYYPPLAEYGVMGVPGTSGKFDVEMLANMNLPVYIMTDWDDAGRKAADEWAKALTAKGIEAVVAPPKADLCDLAQWFVDKHGHEKGNREFGHWLIELMFRHREKLPVQKLFARFAGRLDPKQFPGQAGNHGIRLAQQLVDNVAMGHFEGVIDGSPIIRLSYSDATSILGARYRRQGINTVRYLLEIGVLHPLTPEEHKKTLSWRADNPTTPPSINQLRMSYYKLTSPLYYCFTDGGEAGKNAFRCRVSRDGAQRTERLTPITARGQMLVARVKHLGKMTLEEAREYLGLPHSVLGLVTRLEKMRLVHLKDGVIYFGSAKMLARTIKHIKEFCFSRKEQMWETLKQQYKLWLERIKSRLTSGSVITNKKCSTKQSPPPASKGQYQEVTAAS